MTELRLPHFRGPDPMSIITRTALSQISILGRGVDIKALSGWFKMIPLASPDHNPFPGCP